MNKNNLLLIMKWKCLDCPALLKKSERYFHRQISGHLINPIGALIHPSIPFPSTVVKKEVTKKNVFKFTGKARQDYPKTYEALDALNGLILIENRLKEDF